MERSGRKTPYPLFTRARARALAAIKTDRSASGRSTAGGTSRRTGSGTGRLNDFSSPSRTARISSDVGDAAGAGAGAESRDDTERVPNPNPNNSGRISRETVISRTAIGISGHRFAQYAQSTPDGFRSSTPAFMASSSHRTRARAARRSRRCISMAPSTILTDTHTSFFRCRLDLLFDRAPARGFLFVLGKTGGIICDFVLVRSEGRQLVVCDDLSHIISHETTLCDDVCNGFTVCVFLPDQYANASKLKYINAPAVRSWGR